MKTRKTHTPQECINTCLEKIKRESKPQHTPTPWKLTDPIHDSKNGYSWNVPIFSDQAESGDKLPAEAIASSRELARANAAFIVRAVNARSRHVDALVQIKHMCEKQIVNNPMGKTIAPEIHALVMKALDSYDIQDALSEGK